MKTIIITAFIIFFSLRFVQGQTYHPLVKESSVWNVTVVNYSLYPWEQDTYSTTSWLILGDTMINSINYKKLSTGIYCNDTSSDISNFTYTGAIREDSTKKVFLLKDSTEYILYDFSLNTGDTFIYQPGYYSNCYHLIITGLDSVLINGEYHKKYIIQPDFNGWTYDWIEGLGSLTSLIDYVYPWGNFDVHLSCYFENLHNTDYSGSSGSDCCMNSLKINNVKVPAKTMQLLQDPISGKYHIINNITEITKIIVTDVNGRLIKILRNINEIYIPNLNAGIYFADVYCKNDNKVFKLILF
ncbi:MAG: T9SS type A sorting domain-containing protein [Bacteroidia bacterium]|nr:T9SS type A sorting domain-containing protein [Bacteroidia bacterium]